MRNKALSPSLKCQRFSLAITWGSSDFVFNSFIYGKSNPIFGNIFKFDNKQKRKTPGRAKF